MLRGRVFFLALALVLSHVVAACVGGAESGSKLNPQPLPPVVGEDSSNNEDDDDKGGFEAPTSGAESSDGGTDAARDARLE